MARRMAGTDSAFTIGMRAGQEVGGMIAKTAEVLNDRADKKKAEQVELEYNKNLEAIKAPWTEVQERARGTAKSYADKGQDIPMEEARTLQQEIRTVKMDYLTNSLDLAMTTLGSNMGNKYVQERFKPVVDGMLTQMQVVSNQAQQEQAAQKWEWEKGQAAQDQANVEMGRVERGAEADAVQRRFEEGEAGKDRRAKMAAGNSGPAVNYSDMPAIAAQVEEEGKSKPDEFWQTQLQAAGLNDTPVNRVNVQNVWAAQRARQLVGAKYPGQEDTLIPSPNVITPPADNLDTFIDEKKSQIRALSRSAKASDRALVPMAQAALDKAIEKKAKRDADAKESPELVAAREMSFTDAGSSARGWFERLKYAGKKGWEFVQTAEGGVVPDEVIPIPEGSPWEGGMSTQEPMNDEPPVGTVLHDAVEDDFAKDPELQKYLNENYPDEAGYHLDKKRMY